jgi:hypothetical protein
MSNLEGDALAAWLRARAGKLTASCMSKALDKLKDGTPSKKATDYMKQLVAERLTGDSVRHFVTDAMQWGLEMEAEAKAYWQAETGQFISEWAFFDHPEIDNLGASTDGQIEPDGLIEFKCPTTPVYMDWVMAGVVPEEHKPQMLIQMACTRRKWCEFVAYDPRVRQRPMFRRRYEPKWEEVEAMEGEARAFLLKVDALFDAFVEAAP